MNNKKLIGVGLLSVLGLIGVVLLVYAAVINWHRSGNDTLSPTAGSDIINGSCRGRYDSPPMMPMVITLRHCCRRERPRPWQRW
jgi:hypothetical protein